jgi:hypothetical protein
MLDRYVQFTLDGGDRNQSGNVIRRGFCARIGAYGRVVLESLRGECAMRELVSRLGPPSNTRVKLPAPGLYGSVLFVNFSAGRGSLRAIR